MRCMPGLQRLAWMLGLIQQSAWRAGEVFKGAAAIVTVPLGCLKADAINFQPPLPAWKGDAIAKLGYGALNKARPSLPWKREAGCHAEPPMELNTCCWVGRGPSLLHVCLLSRWRAC